MGQELLPLSSIELAIFFAGSLGSAAGDERPVVSDHVLGVDRGVPHRGVEKGVAADLRRDVRRKPRSEGVGGEDVPCFATRRVWLGSCCVSPGCSSRCGNAMVAGCGVAIRGWWSGEDHSGGLVGAAVRRGQLHGPVEVVLAGSRRTLRLVFAVARSWVISWCWAVRRERACSRNAVSSPMVPSCWASRFFRWLICCLSRSIWASRGWGRGCRGTPWSRRLVRPRRRGGRGGGWPGGSGQNHRGLRVAYRRLGCRRV